MKILIYQPRVSYFTGGGEIYPLQTAKFFTKLGHDVTILTTRAPFLKFSEYFLNFIKDNPNVKIDYLELDDNYKDIYDEPAGISWLRWDKESLWVARPAYEYMINRSFDIVAVHCIIDALSVPFKQKHVMHLHGTPEKPNYFFDLMLSKEKNLIAVSEKVACKWKEFGACDNIRISTNAIDDKVFFPIEGINRNIDLLFVGRLIPIKGVQYILDALKILKEDYNLTPNLTIIGDGPYKQNLIEHSKKLKINDQVKFCGLVSQETLIKAYQTAKLAVLPSYDKEGIMSTLLEAASCKTPAITTRGTSMEEFAGNDINAILTNPRDSIDLCKKIYTMLTDDELSKKIANSAYNTVKEKYNWLSKAKELIKLYQE